MNWIITRANEWSQAWWQWVTHAGWQAATVCLVVLVVVALGRRWPAPLRYALLLVALVKFAAPPMLTLPTGVFSVAGLQVQMEIAAPEVPGRMQVPNSSLVRQLSDPLEREIVMGQLRRLPPVPAPMHWKAWLMLAHLTGIVLMVRWIVAQSVNLSRLKYDSVPIREGKYHAMLSELAKRMKLRRVPEFYSAARLEMPIAFGVLQPTIVLPETLLLKLSSEELRTIMAHELAHFRRGDLWVNAVQLGLLSVWWFHPFCWILNRALRRVREDCCDDLLLAQALTSKETYCEMLVRAARELSPVRTSVAALALGENLHPVAKRLVRIMDESLARAPRLPVWGAVVALGVAMVLLPGVRSQPAPRIVENARRVVRVPVKANLTIEEEDRQMGIQRPPIVISPEITGLTTQALFERMLKSEDPGLRKEIGNRKEEAARFLSGVLESPSMVPAAEPPKVRTEALNQLFSLATRSPESIDEEGIAALKRTAEGENGGDAALQESAINTLGFIGPRAASALPLLKAGMLRGDRNATLAFCRVARDDKALREVLGMIQDEKGDIRQRSMLVDALRGSGAVGPKSQHPDAEEALMKAYDSGDWRLQRKIGTALLYCPKRGPETEAIIQRTFKDPEQARNTGRGEFLDLSVAQLIEHIRDPRDRNDDAEAARELHFHLPNITEALPALIAMLEDERRPSRASAIGTIGMMGKAAEAAVPALERFLASEHPMRWMALHGFMGIYSPRDPIALGYVLKGVDDKDPQVSQKAIQMLNAFSHFSVEVSGPLLTKLHAFEPGARFSAATLLWRFDKANAEKVLPVFIAELAQEIPSRNERNAIRMLAEIGPGAKPAVPSLQVIAENPTRSESVRAEAKRTIEKIGVETKL